MDWIVNFILGILPFLSNFIKVEIPLEFGFLSNNKIFDELSLPVGHPLNLITFRFRNNKKTTVTGVSYEIRIYRPLVLSSTGSAIRYTDIIGDKIKHSQSEDNSYY